MSVPDWIVLQTDKYRNDMLNVSNLEGVHTAVVFPYVGGIITALGNPLKKCSHSILTVISFCSHCILNS